MPPVYFPCIPGMTCMCLWHMPNFLLVEMRVSLTFCLTCPQAMILPISTSWVARILDKSYRIQLYSYLLSKCKYKSRITGSY
jgi:hypothetical protein